MFYHMELTSAHETPDFEINKTKFCQMHIWSVFRTFLASGWHVIFLRPISKFPS